METLSGIGADGVGRSRLTTTRSSADFLSDRLLDWIRTQARYHLAPCGALRYVIVSVDEDEMSRWRLVWLCP